MKYLKTKKIGGENSVIKDYFNSIKDYFNNKICDDCDNPNFCENNTEYRVVYNNVYFYSNENGKMVKSDDIASLNETLSGTLVFIDNNTYVDLGMNEYIPVFDKETGDILLVTHNKECLNLKEDCGNNRSSLPVQLSVIQ